MPPRNLNLPGVSAYVKGGYKQVNIGLRQGRTNDMVTERINLIEDEWASLPPATCAEVYRCGGLLAEYSFAALQAGQTFTDKAYLSTSTDAGIFDRYGRKGRVCFTITLLQNGATQAKDMHTLIGAKDAEAEVLFPRGTRFRITSYSNPWWKAGIYVTMQEIRSIPRV